MAEITVARALSEIKLLDKRIQKETGNTVFVTYQKGKDNPKGFKDVNEAHSEISASLQKIKDLIARRNKIKSGIVQSNAITKVKISGKEYTVAEAIERKTSIAYEINLLNVLKRQFQSVSQQVDRANEDVERRLDAQLEQLYGSDRKNTDTQGVIDVFKSQNEVKLVDPIGLEKLIKSIEEEIDDFESEVDLALSESNALTVFEIED